MSKKETTQTDLKANGFTVKATMKNVTVDIVELDFHHYLPLFFDGLCETTHPYDFLAYQGIHDMLDRGGSKVLPVVPQLVMPIRNALNTKNLNVILSTLKVLQHLVLSGDKVGEALVPHFKRILRVFNLYKNKNINVVDKFEKTRVKQESISKLIDETLQVFELHGGPDALINIQYMVPTYQSCMKL